MCSRNYDIIRKLTSLTAEFVSKFLSEERATFSLLPRRFEYANAIMRNIYNAFRDRNRRIFGHLFSEELFLILYGSLEIAWFVGAISASLAIARIISSYYVSKEINRLFALVCACSKQTSTVHQLALTETRKPVVKTSYVPFSTNTIHREAAQTSSNILKRL